MKTHDLSMLSYLRGLYAEELRSFAFRGKSLSEFKEWSRSARPALREMVGLSRMEQELDGFTPTVSLGDPNDQGTYTRQKGCLQSEPGFDVPFWFLRPKGPGPHPLALCPHGHYAENGLDYAAGIAASPEMQHKIESEDRDVAVQAVQRGFASIAPSTRGFPPTGIPDINDRHSGRDCRSQFLHALLAGRTVIGERVWDLERLIDWALEQPDIDGSTILMMGNSGGGVATLYAAACDERVSIAVASCSYCTFVGENGVLHHCDCNAVPGILRFGEFHDVAGLVAPRRLLIVNGRTDSLFPLEEVERAVSGVQGIFEAAGVPSALRHMYGPEGHRFYSGLMWPFVMEVEALAEPLASPAYGGRHEGFCK